MTQSDISASGEALFDALGLAEPVLKSVSELGYTIPTPIQAAGIPALLKGDDLFGIAQTGTGKTAAFVLPLLNAIAAHKRRPDPKTCRVLILAPTRELAAQIGESVAAYGKYVRHSSCLVIGGVKPGAQVRALARGVDVLIATPGRLLDHVQSGVVTLDTVSHVVLDEADQMLDMGFIPTIRKLMEKLPAERQTLLFSATMPKPIKALATDFLTDPVEIAVTPQSTPIERITQKLVYAEKGEKPALAIEYLKTAGIERAIVFTRTKYGADKLCRSLEKAGLSAVAIHGNKSQNQRKRALADFKSFKVAVLVATDIAARGIDIDGVSHVVNFDLPNVPEAYVHRIGRTARAGKSGAAIAFCAEDERILLRDIEKTMGMKIDKVFADGTPATDLPITVKTKPGSGGGRRPSRSANRQKPAKSKAAKPAQKTSTSQAGSEPTRDGASRPAKAQKKPHHRGQKVRRRKGQRQGAKAAAPAMAK